MITQEALLNVTESFFSQYWNNDNGEIPEWSMHWKFNGTIPNNTMRGCYALFNKKEVIYIGIGIGKSYRSYHGSGLGDRLKRYWKVNKTGSGNQYLPADDYTEVTSIATIGFEEKHYPLAAALEVFLIRELNPKRNRQHK